MAPESTNRARSVASVLAFAMIYGAVFLVFRTLTGGRALTGDPLWEYRMGALLAVPGQVLMAALVALPLYRAPDRRPALAIASILGGGLLALSAMGTVGWGEGSPAALWVGAFVLIAFFWTRPLASRLESREEDAGGRRADLLSLLMVSTFSLATLLGAEGPLWQGAAGPLAQRLSQGRAEDHAGHDHAVHDHDAIGEPGEPSAEAGSAGEGVPAEVREMVLGLQGIEPFELADARHPYCRADAALPRPSRPRSVLLLLLSDVAERELDLEIEEGPLMPNLRRMAEEGSRFETFVAVGDSASAAVASTFASIPPIAQGRVLETVPPPTLDGFPGDLARFGWATAYARGEDLSVGHRRAFARAVGFEALIEPDPRADGAASREGDAQALANLRTWIETRRADSPQEPFFAALESVGDPIVASGTDPWSAHLDSVARLDRALGDFYEWYLEHEAPRGTVLLVAGANHAPIAAPVEAGAGVGAEAEVRATGATMFRFGVPLVVLGRDSSEGGADEEVFIRPGSHLDLGATVLGLVGSGLGGCYLGLDLLAPVDPEWPRDRVIVSVAAPHGRFLNLRRASYRWINDRSTGLTSIFDVDRDPGLERDLFAEDDPELEVMSHFRRAYQAIDTYLVREDRFRASTVPIGRPPRGPVASAAMVSRGASVPLPEGESAPPPSSLPAIEAALAAGYEWIELEVDVTKDGVVYAAPHAGLLSASQGARIGSMPFSITIHDLSSGQVAAFPQPFAPLGEIIARVADRAGLILSVPTWRRDELWSERVGAVVRAAAGAPPRARIMLRSADIEALATLETFGGRPTVYELTGLTTTDAVLDYLARLGFDVLDVNYRLYGTDLVERARARGLSVMVEDPPAAPTTTPDFQLSDAPPPPAAD